MAAGKLFMPQRMSTSSLACILHLLNLWLLIIIKKKKRHEFWKDGMGKKRIWREVVVNRNGKYTSYNHTKL